jgi:hypothetical protein
LAAVPASSPDPFDLAITRRQLLGLGAAALASTVLAGSPAGAGAPAPAPRQVATAAEALRPPIHPRRDWAADLAVKGELQAEEDVRFLLVHHTASANGYAEAEVPEQIRKFYEFHTGPDKGWADVAYNFFIDRFGGIWEGRAGSLSGPVRGDATGGSQGFALLCSLIGNFQEEQITTEQRTGLVRLLAWLAETYRIDTAPGASTSFVSRGSNLWPAGTEVTTGTIAGHRDMSTTSCPGDLVYTLLDTELPAEVTALRATVAIGSGTSQPPGGDTASSTSTTGTAPGVPETSPGGPPASLGSSAANGDGTAAGAGAPETAGTASPPVTDELAATATGGSGSGRPGTLLVTGGIAAVAAAGATLLARFRAQAGRPPG